jgi:hypothetical protein
LLIYTLIFLDECKLAAHFHIMNNIVFEFMTFT